VGEPEGDVAKPLSLAVVPATSKRSFHKERHGSVDVNEEIVETVYATVSRSDRAVDQVAVVFATLRAAARGELPTGGDLDDELEPSRTQDGLWELKWKRKRKGPAEFRLYHAEPEGGRPDFVALRFHAKSLSGSERDITRAQDAEMRVAMERYSDRAAVRARWGHEGEDGCRACVVDT